MPNLLKKLPLSNILRKKGRSLGIFFLITCLSFSLFVAAFIGLSMKNGLDSTRDRLGADILVMPVDAQPKVEGAILNGEPDSFYFHSDILEKVKSVEGVKQVSPQVFMATLSAGCCAFPVQVIGIDFATDFSVTPWLEGKVENLGKDEILAGHNIVAPKDTNLTFFDHDFLVKERMDATGMGFDNCIFTNIEDARNLAVLAENFGVKTSADKENMISSIMVDVEEGQDIDHIRNDINKEIRGEGKAARSGAIVNEIGKQMESSANYLLILLGIVWALCLAVLFIVFPLITRARSGELATLRVLGATKKQISRLLLKEMGLLSAAGALAGSVFGLIIALLFSNAIKGLVDTPFLALSMPKTAGVLLACIVICTLVGPLSSLLTIRQLNKKEIAIAYGEKE